MTTNKRSLESKAAYGPQRKKAKVSVSGENPGAVGQMKTTAISNVDDEVDFPRGGGSSFTPLEYKLIRAEAIKEADQELFFKDKGKQEKREKAKRKDIKSNNPKKQGIQNAIRVEQLNYKRIVVGMKILCQVVEIKPLGLIVSLPYQLMGHIPITQITAQLTKTLEAEELHHSNEEDGDSDSVMDQRHRSPPELLEVFRVGQFVRAVVTSTRSAGTTEGYSILGFSRDHSEKASMRVELSLIPSMVNTGLEKADLRSGFTISGSINSIEDHGYGIDLGLSDISGFVSFHDITDDTWPRPKELSIGTYINAIVTSLESNGRICKLNVDSSSLRSSYSKDVASINSVLPGLLVEGVITGVSPSGLNLQILGFFAGTIDCSHLPVRDPVESFNIGDSIKARVLYAVHGATPPQFSLSLLDHVLKLDQKAITRASRTSPIQEFFPVGVVFEHAKVIKVEAERGLIVDLGDGLTGFVHISHVSDDHTPSLASNSGQWRIGSSHIARAIGHHMFDGILQLSLRPSVLEKKFLRVNDVHPGQVVKGIVKKLTDSALFISLSGSVDGVIWPNHFADIPLKHPQKRFRPGSTVKCRVLFTDPERKRIVLTAKKTLVESELSLITSFDEACSGIISHGFVCRVMEKSLLVEFCGHVKAIVSASEASEVSNPVLQDLFPLGKPVKVRILSVDSEFRRIFASIRQASDSTSIVGDVRTVEVGNIADGSISDIHQDNVVLSLEPSRVRALISIKNLANSRGIPVAQLRTTLHVGNMLKDLIVVTRNLQKGLVIVACQPSGNSPQGKRNYANMDSLQPGDILEGRVSRQSRQGAIVSFPGKNLSGLLHLTDISDCFDTATPIPAVDEILQVAIVSSNAERKQIVLSTRASRLASNFTGHIVDREVTGIEDLKVGETVAGFVKAIHQHGLFVNLGREIDARVQIKELFDSYIKDWQSKFHVNQVVRGRIISIDQSKKQVELSLRSAGRSAPSITFENLSEGQIYDGLVKRVEAYGLFIEIEGSRISGLCHKTEITDNPEADVDAALRNFREGDKVKAYVVSIDQEKRKFNLSLKPSYISPQELDNNSDDDIPVSKSSNDKQDLSDDDDSSEAEESHSGMHQLTNPFLEESSRLHFDTSSKAVSKQGFPHTTLTLGGFQWNDGDDATSSIGAADDSEIDDSGTTEIAKRKGKKRQIEEDLTLDMHSRKPESTADFERHLLGSPDSSYLWIQYMSFQVQLSEIEKAREVGRRALQTINFREEQEKLNVWVALLNLENLYGTEETLDKLFKDAARHNDSKTVHLRFASILEHSGKHEKARDTFARACKKFGQSHKVWKVFAEYYMRNDERDRARALLPRSLQSLERRKHLKTISAFAQMEYKLGDPERGKTIFESMLDSHPKRWDLWSVYMDMEATQTDIQTLRNIFERVFALKMTNHKAKAFFKKWLDLERRIGDEAGVENVKAKAIEWTQRASNSVPV